MQGLYLANIVVLLVAGWAVWQRRLAFQSRWDAPLTYGIVLFGIGAALDSPWPGVAAASFPLTGKYYLLMTVGHICYLVGAATGIKTIYLRLLPDDTIGRLMRRRIAPLILAASVVMMVCMLASPLTSTMPVAHLYLRAPDGWQTVYWVVFLGTLLLLEIISIFGLTRLRADSRSVMVDLLIASQAVGILACVAIGFAVVTNRGAIASFLVWPFGYMGIAGGAVAAALGWRYRMRALTTPPERL